MVTRRYSIVLALICGLGFLIRASEFIEKRTAKAPSVATLKEECCEQFGELLKQIPQLLRVIAQLQTEALTVIQGYWESDKQSWCAQASRQKLLTCRDRLTLLQKKIDHVIAECDQTFKEIKA